MKLSLILPAFNEARLLGGTLAAIRRAADAFTAVGADWEWIVCDNNSTDETAQIAQEIGAKVVFEPVNQIARARNRGASVATGDWLVFIDADTHPSRELFVEMLAAIRRPDVIGGGATLRVDGNRWVARSSVAIWNGISLLKSWAAGSFLFVEAAAFRQLGGFNQDLFASEELDLSKRLSRLGKRSGRRMVILPGRRLVTSGRKLDLYTLREHARFFIKALLFPDRVLNRREECTLWYDGRR